LYSKDYQCCHNKKTDIAYHTELYVRELHNAELHNSYTSSNIIRMIKSGRMILAGYVARMGEKNNPYRVLVEKPEGKRPLEDLDVGGKIK
jgi:hypothetical protein